MFRLPILSHHSPGDLILGRQSKLPISPLVRVPALASAAHISVIGMSGKGKSRLLEHCLCQDVATGRGYGLIDPHSLLTDDLLRLLATRGAFADRSIRDRLIYVDPARTDYVVPFKVLVTEAEHLYHIAAAVLEAFRRTWPYSARALTSLPRDAARSRVTIRGTRKATYRSQKRWFGAWSSCRS
jgi:DNA helicase HerA-like ATPase